MIYTLTLNPAIDHVIRLKNLENGETNRAFEESISAGGKGINVSKILKNLGEESMALGYLAGFTGKEIERILEEDEKIACDFIFLEKGFTRINTKIKADHETEINGPGPVLDEKDIDLLMEKFDAIKEGDYLFLSGSIPASLGDGFYALIMKRLKDKGVSIVVDCTGKALEETLEFSPILVKPNVRELEDFFKTEIKDNGDIEKYARKLMNMGPKNVIVSMGREGAYFISQDGESLFLDAPKGKVVDTVGSGDSMVAGFIYGLKKGFSPVESFKFAVSCGSASAFSSKLATKEEAFGIYQKLTGR